MKSICWNHPFRFTVALYEGDDVNIEAMKDQLKRAGFHFRESVKGRRHHFTVDVTLQNVHKAVAIVKHEEVLA